MCLTDISRALTSGDVEAGDDVLGDVVKVLHQGSQRVAVSGDLRVRVRVRVRERDGRWDG